MKQANNNEIDVLLKSLARQRGAAEVSQASAAENGGRRHSNHLDADELNSYAEGVLPLAARARYTEHLADCDDCRGLVVSLSQAAGTAGRQQLPQQADATLWQKLAALFSLPLIRVAVPALMLTAVIGVGLWSYLRQNNRQFVAQNDQARSTQSPAVFDGSTNKVDDSVTRDSQSPHPSSSPVDRLESGNGNSDRKAPAVGSEEIATRSEVEKAPAAKDVPAKEGPDAGARIGEYALEPKAAAAPPPPSQPASKMGELARSADTERDEGTAKREDQNQNRSQYEFKTAPNDARGPNRAAQSNNAVLSQNQAANVAGRARGPSGLDKSKKGNEVESRTVGGRRFIRNDDGWVDTAYDSDMATTKITRGSDHFRALVADEPGIRTIAEQLDGVVIVVWKGRAYRIK